MRAASAVCSGRGHALRRKRRACRPAARNAAFDRDAVRFRPQQTRGAAPDEPLDVRTHPTAAGTSSTPRAPSPTLISDDADLGGNPAAASVPHVVFQVDEAVLSSETRPASVDFNYIIMRQATIITTTTDHEHRRDHHSNHSRVAAVDRNRNP